MSAPRIHAQWMPDVLEVEPRFDRASLPAGVVPYLAPDATALGQIFWYTVEGEGRRLDELQVALVTGGGTGIGAGISGYLAEEGVQVALRAFRPADDLRRTRDRTCRRTARGSRPGPYESPDGQGP